MRIASYYEPVPVDATKIDVAYENAAKQFDIIKRAKEGESYEEIAKLYSITRQRVEQIIKRHYNNYNLIKKAD